MLKLTREQVTQKEAMLETLREIISEGGLIAGERTTFDDFRGILGKAATLAEDVRNFVSDVNGEQQDYFENRSERWKESESGNQYEMWVAAWEEFDSDIDTVAEDLEGYSSDKDLFDGGTAEDILDSLRTFLDAFESLANHYTEV